MKDIIIRCCPNSLFLRTEAMAKAIEFEERYSKEKGIGFNKGVLWVKYANNSTREWSIYVYQTKKSIIVRVQMQNK